MPLPANGNLPGYLPGRVVRIAWFLYRQKDLWESRKLHPRRAKILFAGSNEIWAYVTERRGGLLLSPQDAWELNYNKLTQLVEDDADISSGYSDDDVLDAWLYRQMWETFHGSIDPRKESRLVELVPEWVKISDNRVSSASAPAHWTRRSEMEPEDLFACGRNDCGGCDGRHPKNKIQTMVCPGCDGEYDNRPECIGLESMGQAVDLMMGDNNWLCVECSLNDDSGDLGSGGGGGSDNDWTDSPSQGGSRSYQWPDLPTDDDQTDSEDVFAEDRMICGVCCYRHRKESVVQMTCSICKIVHENKLSCMRLRSFADALRLEASGTWICSHCEAANDERPGPNGKRHRDNNRSGDGDGDHNDGDKEQESEPRTGKRARGGRMQRPS